MSCCGGPPSELFQMYFGSTTWEVFIGLFGHLFDIISGCPITLLLTICTQELWNNLCISETIFSKYNSRLDFSIARQDTVHYDFRAWALGVGGGGGESKAAREKSKRPKVCMAWWTANGHIFTFNSNSAINHKELLDLSTWLVAHVPLRCPEEGNGRVASRMTKQEWHGKQVFSSVLTQWHPSVVTPHRISNVGERAEC